MTKSNSIINEKPNYSFDENRKTSINNAFSVEEILDEIVYQTRTILIGKEHDYNKLLNMNLANYCELSTNFIIELANKYNIEAKFSSVSLIHPFLRIVRATFSLSKSFNIYTPREQPL